MGVPAPHEQPYSRLVLKIRSQSRRSPPSQFASFTLQQVGGFNYAGNQKGCDIGYVPAICSCERAHSVDTGTVAALDAITAFTIPNPGSSSQSQPVFSGLVALSGRPAEQITQPTSDWQI